MTASVPAISIVMPAWNSERFLQEAIDSVRAQTFTDFELLLIDDGSTDGTLEIMRRAACEDPRIRVIPMEHSGLVPALNHGVAEAKADWIGRMDSDDIVYPDWLESVWAVKEQHPEVILFHSRLESFGDGTPQRGVRIPRTRGLYALRSCFQCVMPHPSVVFHKAAFTQAGGYDRRDLHVEDYALWGRMLEVGPFKGIPKINLKVRLHENSTTTQAREVHLAEGDRVARLHCVRFLGASEKDAERLLRLFRKGGPTGEWLWFIRNYLPRLRWLSLEAVAWVGLQLARSVIRKP